MALIVLTYLNNKFMNLMCAGITLTEKIFGFKMSESVKTLIYFMQRIDFRKLYDPRRLTFMSKLQYLQRDVIANLLPLSLTADDVNDLFCT